MQIVKKKFTTIAKYLKKFINLNIKRNLYYTIMHNKGNKKIKILLQILQKKLL